MVEHDNVQQLTTRQLRTMTEQKLTENRTKNKPDKDENRENVYVQGESKIRPETLLNIFATDKLFKIKLWTELLRLRAHKTSEFCSFFFTRLHITDRNWEAVNYRGRNGEFCDTVVLELLRNYSKIQGVFFDSQWPTLEPWSNGSCKDLTGWLTAVAYLVLKLLTPNRCFLQNGTAPSCFMVQRICGCGKGRGTYMAGTVNKFRATFKSCTEKRRLFPCHFWWPGVIRLISQTLS